MDKVELVYWGEDRFSRPIWRDKVLGEYYGSTDVLVPNRKLGIDDVSSLTNYFKERMELITYFGNRFDCEPMGTRINGERYELTGEYKETHPRVMYGLIVTQRERDKRLKK